MPLVSIGIVTWNAEHDIGSCLEGVRAQTHRSIEVLVADNASSDGTLAQIARAPGAPHPIAFDRNLGFAAAHNALIGRSRGTYYLALNPDVVLAAGYVQYLVSAMERAPEAGSATGKLLREQPPDVVDSAGIVMRPAMRHLDRGAGEVDRGQFDRVEWIFGASGAAALYRREMLDDVRVRGECFDEDFFAYREDADLAWRAQRLGWRCLYVPDAVARHRRHVTPERRGTLAPAINRWSVRNRFLLRVKNQCAAEAMAFFWPTIRRDAQVIGYVVLREWSSLGGLLDAVRLLPRALGKRRDIMRRRRDAPGDIVRWFREESRPCRTLP